MDELERVINRAEALEREQAEAADFSQPESETERVAVASVDALESAANRAEALMRVAEGAIKMFVDSRLMLDEDEIQSGRDSLAPVLDKYALAGEGSGHLPYQEEITAGFYLGGLWKRFRRALFALRARDKAEKQARENQQHGEERKHQPEKPTQPLPGKERLRQEPDADKEGWNSESWGAGGSLG